MQLASSALLSLSHGGNDAQKTMGIVALLLYSTSLVGTDFHIPFWVVISCHLVMGLGTLAGGFRIVKTMGQKITFLNPVGATAAQTSAAIIISCATNFGIPVSTTHTVTGAIAGVGAAKNSNGTQWSVMYRIFSTWLLTIPASALISAIIFSIIQIMIFKIN